ncbi:MAG: DUF5677 domain-containing protein [Candidatus Poribacteria bacterium]|nr:DUF5677 domain-containing protein [Candidatus Poribacteria bacterium]
MDEKVPELLNLTKKLLDQTTAIVKAAVLQDRVGLKEVRYQIFLRVQLSETLKFGYGAYYSCYHGWGHGAIGAARSIYEILLDIKYINQDETLKEIHFSRFVDHGAEYFYHEMQRILQLGEEVSQEVQNERAQKYEQLKKKYNDKHKQEVDSGTKKADATSRYRPYNWAGIDLSEKVKKLNIDNFNKFHQFYKNLSNLSHVNIGATLDAIKEITDDQFTVNWNLCPGPKHSYSILIVIFPCILWILMEYMEYFEIKHSRYPNLEKIEEDFKNLLQ